MAQNQFNERSAESISQQPGTQYPPPQQPYPPQYPYPPQQSYPPQYSNPPQYQYPPQQPYPPYYQYPPTKKRRHPFTKKNVLIIALVVILIIAVIGILNNNDTDKVNVDISYNGPWRGSIWEDEEPKSISGVGSKSYEVSGNNISAKVYKMEAGSGKIKVQITVDGVVYASKSTNRDYGVVSVTCYF